MSRLVRLLDEAQRFGSRIGAFKNIGWLVVLLAGAGAVFLRYAAGLRASLLAVVLFSLLAVALLLGNLLWYRRLCGPGYRWIAAEYVYHFDESDLRRQTQRIKIKIRAVRNNVCCFENSYQWSGTGESTISVTSGGHRYVGEVPADDSKKLYWIHLDTALDRGQETEIEVEQKLFDDHRSLKPMLTKRISGQLDTLTLTAIFPRAAVPEKVVAREVTYSTQAPHWRQTQLDQPEWRPDGGVTEISYSPAKPRRNHRYELMWGPWDVYAKSDISP